MKRPTTSCGVDQGANHPGAIREQTIRDEVVRPLARRVRPSKSTWIVHLRSSGKNSKVTIGDCRSMTVEHLVNEKRIRRVMRLMGLMPIYQKPNTSKAAKGHKTYPYLLRGLRVDRPNQVWAADITYLPMWRGSLYLVAIIDWHTRKVLAWRISNTLEIGFCVEALNEAIACFGPPEIMNADQGSQFTSFAWTDQLRRAGVRISMDGKGRFLDNIFVERLWRSLKYECV